MRPAQPAETERIMAERSNEFPRPMGVPHETLAVRGCTCQVCRESACWAGGPTEQEVIDAMTDGVAGELAGKPRDCCDCGAVHIGPGPRCPACVTVRDAQANPLDTDYSIMDEQDPRLEIARLRAVNAKLLAEAKAFRERVP